MEWGDNMSNNTAIGIGDVFKSIWNEKFIIVFSILSCFIISYFLHKNEVKINKAELLVKYNAIYDNSTENSGFYNMQLGELRAALMSNHKDKDDFKNLTVKYKFINDNVLNLILTSSEDNFIKRIKSYIDLVNDNLKSNVKKTIELKLNALEKIDVKDRNDYFNNEYSAATTAINTIESEGFIYLTILKVEDTSKDIGVKRDFAFALLMGLFMSWVIIYIKNKIFQK
ncbi:hypothetical protein LDJ79_06320 [Vibrio tritonius]|uniref:Polysaccharide chain length determinant N-terminal domain-containing protein n=1 Tax=Vibrio tritonius TaxID=1435069 RepID=A0ABS7YK26_9VIBR|nr:hypothetical protein [Vibrio tritonius]MCA2015718.1 hypothetical protein [Vibrio tritonius]